MQLGGNAKAREHFKKYGLDGKAAKEKYSNANAIQYKQKLKAQVEKVLGKNKPEENGGGERLREVHSAPVLSEKWDFEEAVSNDLKSVQKRTQSLALSDDEAEQSQHVVKTAQKKKTMPIRSSSTTTTKSGNSSPTNIFGNPNAQKQRIQQQQQKKAQQNFFDDDDKKKKNDDDDWNSWDNDDEWGSSKKSKSVSSPSQSSTSSYNNNSNSYSDDNNYSNSSPSTQSNGGSKYVGIGSNPSYNASRSRNTGISLPNGVSLSDLSASDMAWYLSESAKDQYGHIAKKTVEYGSYISEVGESVGSKVSDWFSKIVQDE